MTGRDNRVALNPHVGIVVRAFPLFPIEREGLLDVSLVPIYLNHITVLTEQFTRRDRTDKHSCMPMHVQRRIAWQSERHQSVKVAAREDLEANKAR